MNYNDDFDTRGPRQSRSPSYKQKNGGFGQGGQQFNDSFEEAFANGLPENMISINIESITSISEIETIWHTGVKQLEEVFHMHM